MNALARHRHALFTAPEHPLASVPRSNALPGHSPASAASFLPRSTARGGTHGGGPRAFGRSQRPDRGADHGHRRLELAAPDRLAAGRRNGARLRVRKGDGRDDVHGRDLPPEPIGRTGRRTALRCVPFRPSLGILGRRGRRERHRTGRPFPLGGRAGVQRAAPRARPGTDGRPVRRPTHALDADVAHARRGSDGPQVDRLCLAELLEGEGRRLPRRGSCGASPVDRALDEGSPADPARCELGWSRLVLLAVEQLPEGRGDQRLRRRQPLQRDEPRKRQRAGVSLGSADEGRGSDDRRRPAGRQAAGGASRSLGRRQADLVRLSVAAVRCRRPRVRCHRRCDREDLHPARDRRRSHAHRSRHRSRPVGHDLGFVGPDARRLGIGLGRRRIGSEGPGHSRRSRA